MTTELIKNPSVGNILKYEFLTELNMSENDLANAINVSFNLIYDIVKGEKIITADTDLRLCRFFGLSEGYFLRLQNSYQIMEAKRNLGEKLNLITPLKI